METLTAAKVVRKVRKRIEVSQEGLARLLNATKGAVQHWERGRNNPDLARLNALRQLCPPGAERKELDTLIKQTQSRLAPLPDTGVEGRAQVHVVDANASGGGLRGDGLDGLARLDASLSQRPEADGVGALG